MNPVTFTVNGVTARAGEGVLTVGDLELVVHRSDVEGGSRLDLAVRNPGRASVALDTIEVAFDVQPDRVLEHGYQSWSVVRRCRPEDVRPERVEAAEWGRSVHLADPDAAGRVVGGDQFLVSTSGVIGFLDGSRNFGTVQARPDGLTAVALLDGVPLGAGEERHVDPLWACAGDPGVAYSTFAELWGAEAKARTTAHSPLGWCSWYQYFAEVTPEAVVANLVQAASHGIELVQLDDGYQRDIGHWTEVDETWGASLADLAEQIRGWGLAAGIWTAPFLAAARSQLVADHPDWVATHRSGHPLRAMFNDSWGGWALGLDTTHPAVLDHLRSTFSTLGEFGFDYHKIDFCYAAAVSATRHDPTMTRAESLRAGLLAVREGIGDDAFLLGCGCPFGPAVGIVDGMRVSADVAPTWDPAGSWPGFTETAPAAVNAVQASVLRAPLHRRVFLNDPDCLLLRPDALEAAQRKVLADTIAGTGGFTVVSDDLGNYGPHQWHELDLARARGSRGDSVLDLADPFARVVRVVGEVQELEVDWDAPWSRLTIR